MKHYQRPSNQLAACGRGGSGELTTVAADVQCGPCQRTLVFYAAVTGLSIEAAHRAVEGLSVTEALKRFGWPKEEPPRAPAVLKYNDGPEMTSAPANMRLAAVADLLRHGHSVYVILEPGDQTRYELVLVPISNIAPAAVNNGSGVGFLPARGGLIEAGWGPEYVLMVTRLVGGKPEVTAMVEPGRYWERYDGLANGNDWTGTLLAWWFNELFLEMKLEF